MTDLSVSYSDEIASFMKSTAYRFFDEFCAYNTNSKDKLRSARPHEVDREAAIDAIEEDPTLVVEKLADDVNCGHATISRILKADIAVDEKEFCQESTSFQWLSLSQREASTLHPNRFVPKMNVERHRKDGNTAERKLEEVHRWLSGYSDDDFYECGAVSLLDRWQKCIQEDGE
ncbi:hypothetical protein KIN20_035762 [Parelaphostrongylus tenuis]|uniref:Transposase n=1 Tax=Parelaphostrongylus tenuis TaxID=148309 RepID=A0AAD5RBQ8_PARTN|nr:hypothetical protein KIN20_035762 [Parelaphostrongylus tenuis]